MNDVTPSAQTLVTLFGNANHVVTSRSDLRQLGAQGRMLEFIVATILWGYPQGMRGAHFQNMMNSLDVLCRVLQAARAGGVANWLQHYPVVTQIRGLGPSTYSKFLCFLDVNVQGRRALILDNRIIRVAQAGIFDELQPIANLTTHTAIARYPAYLDCLHQTAAELQVPAENLEFALFEFGLNLK
jgi:hypothetical protein